MFSQNIRVGRVGISDFSDRKVYRLDELPNRAPWGGEVVILAAGPSLPRAAIWKKSRFPVIGLNRAVAVHSVDYLLVSTDTLKLKPVWFNVLLNCIPKTSSVISQNYYYFPREGINTKSTVIKNKKKNCETLANMSRNVFLCADIVGKKQLRRFCGLSDDVVDISEDVVKYYTEKLFTQYVFFGPATVLIAAIEMARFLGARKIHIFGSDAKRIGGRRYCDEYKIPIDNISDLKFDRRSVDMVRHIEMANELFWKATGIEIINYSTNSDVNCFERRHLREFPA